MRGLLADTNVQAHASYLRRLLEAAGLLEILEELNVEFLTLGDVELPLDIDDRAIWRFCQLERLVLFTDNRNEESDESLQSTVRSEWKWGDLPVITLGDKRKFERIADYRQQTAADLSELLFGIYYGEYRDCARLYVPRQRS